MKDPVQKLNDLLKNLKEGDHQIIDLEEFVADELNKKIPVEPLTKEEAMLVCNADWKPRVGDIVMLRDDWPFSTRPMKFPVPGETCIVTKVISDPMLGERGDGGPVVVDDMIIGFRHRCGSEGCHMEGAFIEYAHDSRYFRRIGSIYDKDAPVLQRPAT